MKLDMIGIIVRDMEKALNFYALLGLTPTLGSKDDAYVEIGNQGVRLSLNTLEMITGVLGFEPNLTGDKIELAFSIPSNHEVDELVTLIKKHDYDVIKEPWQAPWGQYYALVRDVDGNIISLFCEKL